MMNERVRLMAKMLNDGQTQRAIAIRFDVTPARVSQIVGNAAIRLWKRENAVDDGYKVWREVFLSDTRKCAVFLLSRIDAP
jgi:predicted transcriptional regulator